MPSMPALGGFIFYGLSTLSDKKVQCFIDGFNLYHAIHDLKLNHLKWVNLKALTNIFLQRSEFLSEVHYFSAIAHHRGVDSISRHTTYLDALKAHGITVHLGNFKKKSMSCRNCGNNWKTHEEKESDVNLAIQLVHQAHIDGFDKAYVLTADSDLLPPMRLIKQIFPNKEIHVLFPPSRKTYTSELQSIGRYTVIKQKHMVKCLLPEECYYNGNRITRPVCYTPPP